MFALSEGDLKKRILDCGGGPACFNASLAMRGGHVVSLDPIYCLSSNEITSRINEAYNLIMGGLRTSGRHGSLLLDRYNN